MLGYRGQAPHPGEKRGSGFVGFFGLPDERHRNWPTLYLRKQFHSGELFAARSGRKPGLFSEKPGDPCINALDQSGLVQSDDEPEHEGDPPISGRCEVVQLKVNDLHLDQAGIQ